ncbi:MAG: TetR/AcrR family transcriptional regulator [Aquabacterium sp.]|uniref:TetR/AcrR family transcriptional regulator n=1 Tax=Aquabacterium sp. TaxID=1872578 RepID=UPI00271BE7F3|nr:TetR/AcrR family transcriptional regulator [Aquabacterium sp.]MDO9005764.1 TetR/AcrR family transcriptional regulator [Aquabacterium sp.]
MVKSSSKTSSSYHHGNLRSTLVEQGLVLLEGSQQGELSLRELARHVGVSANAAYRHFANKEALLAALAAEGFRRLNAVQVQAAMATSDMDKGFRQSGRAYVRFAQDNPALFRLMFSRLTSGNPTDELSETSQTSFRTLQTAVSAVTGVPIDDRQTTVMAMAAWSVVHGLSHLALDGQLDHHDGKVDDLIDQVIGMLQTSIPLR